jgi:enterochelin esterase-like enzyme
MRNVSGLGRDRFAVWEWEQHGELVATGDWLVSDAERATAGRETVAARSRRLLPANRDRAAARYADSGLPDGEELVRVWVRREPAALAERLGPAPLTVWAEDGILHVLWRGEAAQASLMGGVQLPLWPVDGADGLWEASVRVRRLDEAVVSCAVAAMGETDAGLGRSAGEPVVFHGSRAPVPHPDRTLTGDLHEHTLESAALGAARGVTVYVPPGAGSRALPACALADGQSVPSLASSLEAAILAGTTPPVVLVGVHNAFVYDPDRPPPKADLRNLEYLPQRRSRRFAAHLSFVTAEVVPWAAARFPVSPGPWLAAGFSSGAAWAIAAGQRRPGAFGGVAALSAGVVPGRVARGSRQVRHYLAAGTLEPDFRRQTRRWAQRLDRSGTPFAYREWAGGHDDWWWRAQLPEAITWLLGS